MDRSDNVIDLWQEGFVQRRAAAGGRLWSTIRDVAIFPAFRACADRLKAQGIDTAISLVEQTHRPFTALWWQGYDLLEGQQVGVMFTYGGSGRLAFDVTGAMDTTNSRVQTHWHTELFSADERELTSKVLLRASLGMGMLQAMAASGPMPAVETRHIARRSSLC